MVISFTPINDMIGGNSFDMKPGSWNDDNPRARCLAESLRIPGIQLKDQMERYGCWWQEGHLNITGTCDALFKN
jgi:ADP-ribosyl-[dinitrogen reductase] hydrolase